MAQSPQPLGNKRLLSVSQCLRFEGNARGALRKLDFVVRQSAIAAKSGLSSKEQSEVERALTTVLMTIATDMAFAAGDNNDEDELRAQAHALLDESFDWSAKKNAAVFGGEGLKLIDIDFGGTPESDVDE